MMLSEMPDVEIGTPPNSEDMNEEYEWWAKAQNVLREYWQDGLNVMVGEKASMAPRYEIREVEKSASHESTNPDGSLSMETHTWTEEEKVPVGEKKVTHGFHIDVVIETEAEKRALIALAQEAELNIRERSGSTRFTHRIDS